MEATRIKFRAQADGIERRLESRSTSVLGGDYRDTFSQADLEQIIYNAGYEAVELKERVVLEIPQFGDKYSGKHTGTKIVVTNADVNTNTVDYVYVGVRNCGSRTFVGFHSDFKKGW